MLDVSSVSLRYINAVIFFSVLFAFSCSIIEETPDERAEVAPPNQVGLWVFTDEKTDPQATRRLLDYADDRSIDRLYVSVYREEPNENGRLLYSEDRIRHLISGAQDLGIEVWAAYGNPDWPEIGCGSEGFPCQRIREVLAYNRENKRHSFDGVMLDVEPEDEADFVDLLALYADVVELLEPTELDAATTIRAFWDAEVAFPGDDSVKRVYEHVIDQSFQHMVVMCYRNFASGPNGAIELCADEMQYAEQSPSATRVIVGLRTTSVELDSGWVHETFYDTDPSQAEDVVRDIVGYFDQYSRFSGLAFHRYEPSAS